MMLGDALYMVNLGQQLQGDCKARSCQNCPGFRWNGDGDGCDNCGCSAAFHVLIWNIFQMVICVSVIFYNFIF